MDKFKLLGLVAPLLLLVIPAGAQLTISYHAGTELTASYYAGDPDDYQAPSLSLSTTSTPPASINYNGATGTFQLDFLAPEGYQFVVNPLDGPVYLSFQVAYTNYYAGGASGGLSASGTPEITLLGVTGSAPSFSNWSTLGDLPHAYLSVSVGAGDITEAFSFTGLRYTVTFAGTGNDVTLPHFEGGNLTVSDDDYQGLPPGDHLQLLAVTSAIPEPGTSAALAGVAALVIGAGVRRFRKKA